MNEQLLYHYTTMNTFYAMMEYSLCYKENDFHPKYLRMWATNYAYQNDFTECKLFLYALERAVEKYVKAKNIILSSESRKLLHESILEMGVYTISFSEHDDDLTMWRGYGQDGDGVSIGFDFSNLPTPPMAGCYDSEEEIEASEIDREVLIQTDRPIKCKYVKPKGNFISKKLVSKTVENLLSEDKDLIDLKQAFVNYNNAPRYKHYKYKQEKEWRIIKNETLPKYKMVDNKHLVPYMGVKILIDCIKKIVVGPCLSSKETVRNVKNYLLSKHLDIENIEVVESEIPYRNRF